MSEFTLVLSNARPSLSGSVYEHLTPDNPAKWRFAKLYDTPQSPDGALESVRSDPDAVAFGAVQCGEVAGRLAQAPVALWMVLTNAVAGKDQEFNDWYDKQHIHDVVSVPGFVSGRRFNVVNPTNSDLMPWHYLALYEIELDRAVESLTESRARAGGPKMPNPGYMEPGPAALPFRPLLDKD